MTNPYYRQHWIDIEPERHTAYDQILAFHPAMEPLVAPLELRPGLRVLDVGSGPGHTTMELARRVAPSGRVTGVDINAEFVERSNRRAREAGLAAEFVQASFPPLAFADRSFDRIFCKNVLEYVAAANELVAEMARVAAPGAVVVATDSDWDMIAIETGSGDAGLTERILSAAKSIAVKEPRIGRRLYGLFGAAGFSELKVKVLASADTAGWSLPMVKASWARYAQESGRVSESEVAKWLADINRAIERGTFLLVLPQFVVRGIKR